MDDNTINKLIDDLGRDSLRLSHPNGDRSSALTAREFLNQASSAHSKAFIAGVSVGMGWYRTAADVQQEGRPSVLSTPRKWP